MARCRFTFDVGRASKDLREAAQELIDLYDCGNGLPDHVVQRFRRLADNPRDLFTSRVEAAGRGLAIAIEPSGELLALLGTVRAIRGAAR